MKINDSLLATISEGVEEARTDAEAALTTVEEALPKLQTAVFDQVLVWLEDECGIALTQRAREGIQDAIGDAFFYHDSGLDNARYVMSKGVIERLRMTEAHLATFTDDVAREQWYELMDQGRKIA